VENLFLSTLKFLQPSTEAAEDAASDAAESLDETFESRFKHIILSESHRYSKQSWNPRLKSTL